MRLKKEYLILAIVILALAAYLALRSRDRNLYELPAVAPVETKEVNRLEVSKAGQSLVFEKTGSDWYIIPQNYLADPEAIKGMLSVAEALTLTELISESKNYQRYDLDETEGISFKCWAKKDLRFELTIGKTADSYNHTFVKLPGDAAVYHAKGNFRDKFDQQTDGFREKTVLAFDPKSIDALEISLEGTSESFKKMAATTGDADGAVAGEGADGDKKRDVAWVDSGGLTADTDKLSSLLTTLSNLKCESYLPDKTKEDLSDPVYTLVLTGARSYTLHLYAEVEIDGATLVPGVSSENDYPFYLTKWRSENIMKKPEALKKTDAPVE